MVKMKSWGGRFIFEDAGHIRRLTSKQLIDILSHYNFFIKTEWYSNQYWGAVEWITTYLPSTGIANPAKARNILSFFRLVYYRMIFTVLCLLRIPALTMTRYNGCKPEKLSWKRALVVRIISLISPISQIFENLIAGLSMKEWNTRRWHRGGSNMYLHFIHTNSVANH